MTLLQTNLQKLLLKPKSNTKLKLVKISKRNQHNLNNESPFLQLIGYLLNQGKCFFSIFKA